MEHCRDCNSTLKKEETQCWACGAAVEQKQSTQTILGKRFSTCIKLLFYISAGLTVLSLFPLPTPPFMTCLITTIVLHFVKSSSDQMLEKKTR